MQKIPIIPKTFVVGFKGLKTTVDESVMDFEYSPRTFNFAFRGGTLKGDFGIDYAFGGLGESEHMGHKYPTLPQGVEIKDLIIYQRRVNGNYADRLVVQTTTGAVYYTAIFEIDTWHLINGLTLSGKVCAVNYNYNSKDVLLLIDEVSALKMLDGDTFTEIISAPRFSSLAIHHERLYGTVNGDCNQVWFSDDFNPTNWNVNPTSAGFITFSDECGDVLKVVSFLNYLYIFREHGIFRMTAYGDQSEFALKKVFTETGRIYKSSIAMCGDRIIFLAEEGLFSFDGYDVSRIAYELPEIINKGYSFCAYHENKYYIASRLTMKDMPDTTGYNNALIEYDLINKAFAILTGVEVCAMIPSNVHTSTELYLALKNKFKNCVGMVVKDGTVFGEQTTKVFFSPQNNMMSAKQKLIRQITFSTKTDVTLSVVIDDVKYDYFVKGSLLPQTVFVDKGGLKIGFMLSTTANFPNITPLIVKAELV